MSIGNLQGRAYTDPTNALPPATCDRCGQRWMHNDLQFQYDYRGNALQNIRLLVCVRCLDEPQNQLRPIIVPPDPVPIKDPRPGFYQSQEGPPPQPQSAYQIIYGTSPPTPYYPPPPPPFIPPNSIESETGLGYIATEGGQYIELE